MTEPPVRDQDLYALGEAWLRHAADEAGEFWAWEHVDELVRSDPQRGFELTVFLCQRAPDRLLDRVAAGPLEHLIRWHPLEITEKVIDRAHKDKRFRECLGHIWLTRGDVPLHLEKRLQAAAAGRIQILETPGSEADGV